jgi:VWFA-related protein
MKLKRPACAVRVATLAALVLSVHAQAPAAKSAILNVTALDSKGHPVTDLTNAEIQIFDEGKLQPTASFQANATQPASTLILWDLLNGIPDRQHYTNLLLAKTLEPLEKGDSTYVYILTNQGALYPVHGIPTKESEAKPSATPWTKQAGSLLDDAIKNVYGLRNMDALDTGVRTATTLQRFGGITEFFTQLPGPKTVVWITRGVPNSVPYPHGCQEATFEGLKGKYLAGNCTLECRNVQEGKCVDYAPYIKHIATALDGTGAVIYAVEQTPEGGFPAAEQGTASDTLHQLTSLTGGRMYTGGQVQNAVDDSFGFVRGRYQVAYTKPTDGKFHKLKVTCTRKGVKLEAPKGIWAE